MTEYEKEMFDFLTQEKSLQGLIIAKNQFPSIKNQLIITLWHKTEEILKNRLDNNPRWRVKLDNELFNSKSKLSIIDTNLSSQKNELPSFLFCWESLSIGKPYYGFWINMESTEFKGNEIKEHLALQKAIIAKDFDGPEGWWPFWKFDSQLDFNIDDTLLNIIPEKVQVKAEELAKNLIDLFDKMKDEYELILIQFRK